MRSLTDSVDTVLALERAALTRWGQGDPSGYLEISSKDVSYFDPFHVPRIDSLNSLAQYYAPLYGRIRIERDAIVNPRVQVIGEVAILTFNFESIGSEGSMHWHCTEVYARHVEAWSIVHTHWSRIEKHPSA